MGAGTILSMAIGVFGATGCIGLEIDQDAFNVAKRRLAGSDAALFHNGFQDFDAGRLTKNTRLVSNIPFGGHFRAVPTARLVRFIRDCERRGAQSTLLMSRGQAKALVAEMGYRVKNVLVLGQPAGIMYSPPRSA
jgi:16S rRNA A1518/A1519 N6-dimethyltransferase RsmA/KsgA/DIM1 with predicted DNA glycosylase/AP lyase activity